MKIYLTFDYELYFGTSCGTAEKCLLQPTQLLRGATEPYGVKTTQFVDSGYLVRMQEEMKHHPVLIPDFTKVTAQLKEMAVAGHELQLHIHPHWTDTKFNGTEWEMNTARYRLHQFQKDEINSIVQQYTDTLRQLTSSAITTYRAGGWCIQPFSGLKDALQQQGIQYDSSVFPGGYSITGNYNYDFRNSPAKSTWNFEDDPLVETKGGFFKEIPISSIKNSPLFYWKLFLLGRMFPGYHKPLGDGKAMHTPGQRKKLLTRSTLQTVSLDGYNAALLTRALRQHLKKKAESMVIIGHPKSLTPYGADALEKFVKENCRNHEFTTFNRLLPA